VEIIRAVAAISSKVIVSVVAAGAVNMDDWLDSVPALLFAWYSGGEGGHAWADVLLGKVDASGRMPFSTPKAEEHLPYFDIAAEKITYDRWFGQRLLDKLGVAAQFPLGYGLSYTTFAMDGVAIDASPLDWGMDRFTVRTMVVNTGLRSGRHVVQVYGTPQVPDFPRRVLLGFQSVELDSNEKKQVSVLCSTRPLKRRSRNRFVSVEQTIGVEIARYSGERDCLKAIISLP
jgi:hypothetical protein